MNCPICRITFTDPLFALAHSCLMARDDVCTRMIERDRKDRADFLTSVHFKFLLSHTKQVVPWCKASYQTFAILDIRTIDEFIKILDVSKDAVKVSNFLAESLPSASRGPAMASSFPVRGTNAGPSETLTKPLDQMEVPLNPGCQILGESQSEKSDQHLEPMQVSLLEVAPYAGRRDRSALPPFFRFESNLCKRVTCEYCGKCARNEIMQFPDCNFCHDSVSYHHGRCCPVVVADLFLAVKKRKVTRRPLKLHALKPFSGRFSVTACKSSCGCMGAREETEFLDEDKLNEIEHEMEANRRAVMD